MYMLSYKTEPCICSIIGQKAQWRNEHLRDAIYPEVHSFHMCSLHLGTQNSHSNARVATFHKEKKFITLFTSVTVVSLLSLFNMILKAQA
jgi:hypothetical protein